MFHFPAPSPLPMERKWKSTVEVAPSCPRCASPNTKFCYYNNYSLSQPRYFCKGCRRYWTKGGSLRNVPVGGGCRKYRRAKSANVLQNNELPAVSVVSNYSTAGTNETSPAACSSMDPHGGANGSDIDLAVVFAKFLNKDMSCDQHEFITGEDRDQLQNEDIESPDNVSNSLTRPSISCQNEGIKRPDLAQLEGRPQLQLVGEKQHKQEEIRIQELIESDMNAFGLQNLLTDEMVQDALWSDHVATSFPNYVPDHCVQLQDLDSFSVDDQTKCSANFTGDNNWSCLDLSESGVEVFPRP